jgi:hypothetical protein
MTAGAFRSFALLLLVFHRLKCLFGDIYLPLFRCHIGLLRRHRLARLLGLLRFRRGKFVKSHAVFITVRKIGVANIRPLWNKMKMPKAHKLRSPKLAFAIGLLVLSFCSQAQSKNEQITVEKHFKLSAEQIKPLAMGRGGAIASDKITVEGRLVGYMYRTRPHNEQDSGWAFLAGDETDNYMNEPKNHGIYDVNTIANYDPEIIPLLDAPEGSAFIRTPSGLVKDPQGPPSE